MLKLDHLTIQFHHKTVLDNTTFTAQCGAITYIVGKSGIGKSSLLKALTFHYLSDYKYLDQTIQFDEGSQQDFIYKNISFVEQTPLFINNITLENHINLILNTYSLHHKNEELLEKLNISHLLKKYPFQLSGGERLRASLYLNLLKEPQILILDEPTAMLDDKSKDILMEILNDYAKSHIVIIATHDLSIIDQSSTIYKIENKKLVIEDNTKNQIYNQIEEKQNYKLKKRNYLSIWRDFFRHNSSYYLSLLIIISLAISFLTLCFFSNQIFVDYNQSQMNQLSSRDFLVYKLIYENNPYSFRGHERGMSDDDYKKLQTIEGIESIEPRYDISTSSLDTFFIDFHTIITDYTEQLTVNAYENNQFVSKEVINENIELYYHTYNNAKNYDDAVEKYFGDEGIYISKELYQLFFHGKKEIIQPELEFYLPIPMYNCEGIGELMVNPNRVSDDENIPINTVGGNYVLVKMKVKGVLKSGTLTQEDSNFLYHIYVPSEVINDYINQQTIKDTRTVYYIYDHDKCYENSYPKDVTSLTRRDQVVYQKKWTANAYNVTVKNIQDLSDVMKSIEDKGYTVENQYVNTEIMQQLNKSFQEMLLVFSSIITIIIVGFYSYLNYINIYQEKNIEQYLRSLGLQKGQISYLLITKKLWSCLKLAILSSFIVYMSIQILISLQIIVLKPHILMFILIIFLSLIIELIIPEIIRRVSHD